jgi:hypothetical protein
MLPAPEQESAREVRQVAACGVINREDFRRLIVRLDLGDPCERIRLQIVLFTFERRPDALGGIF